MRTWFIFRQRLKSHTHTQGLTTTTTWQVFRKGTTSYSTLCCLRIRDMFLIFIPKAKNNFVFLIFQIKWIVRERELAKRDEVNKRLKKKQHFWTGLSDSTDQVKVIWRADESRPRGELIQVKDKTTDRHTTLKSISLFLSVLRGEKKKLKKKKKKEEEEEENIDPFVHTHARASERASVLLSPPSLPLEAHPFFFRV